MVVPAPMSAKFVPAVTPYAAGQFAAAHGGVQERLPAQPIRQLLQVEQVFVRKPATCQDDRILFGIGQLAGSQVDGFLPGSLLQAAPSAPAVLIMGLARRLSLSAK